MSVRSPSRRLVLLMLGGLAGCGTQGKGASDLWGVMAPVEGAAKPPADPELATFALQPFTGGPGNTLDDLASQIAQAAARVNLKLAKPTDPPATYRVFGHLTAIGSDQGTTVAYVFDVVDVAGVRVYRFIGSEPSGGTDGDPWGGVTQATLAIIGTRVVETLRAWLHGAVRR